MRGNNPQGLYNTSATLQDNKILISRVLVKANNYRASIQTPDFDVNYLTKSKLPSL